MKKLILACAFLTASIGGAALAHDIEDCGSPYTTDMAAIFWQVDDKWADYEDWVLATTGINLSGCIENRFKDNGDVKCKDLPDGVAGRATPGFQTIKIDHGWLDDQSSTQKNRRACIAALMAHEFAHTCFASESRADTIDEATFEWWKDVFGSTNSWASCGIWD